MGVVAAIQDLLIRYPGYRHQPLLGLLWAIVLVAVALGVRLIGGNVIVEAPYLTFIPAVLLATFVGGRAAGLMAAVLGGAAAQYFLSPPLHSFKFVDVAHALTLALYIVFSCLIAILVDALIKIAEQNVVLAKRTEALLTELQHRVKNHIQIVASLLNLQARRADPKAATALADVARRINMISSAYSHLYQADLRIDFADHLHDIADAALSAGRSRRSVEVKCAPLMWSMDLVMPMSLIASELIDNALRHGLLQGEGKVEVTLTREGDSYVLRVTDSGGTLPPGFDVNRTAGLGLQLATAMARRIRGTIRAQHTPRTEFVVEFPAA